MVMRLELLSGSWLNKPIQCHVTETSVVTYTEPKTDFWQRSYYGFRNDNAPAFLFETVENFTITAKAKFEYEKQFDQCGLIIYLFIENFELLIFLSLLR
jgi:regulation of enolase protein 1 (concanavalin A-like superfamily)